MVSDTSLMAWLEVEPTLGEKQQAVYALLRVMPDGMTNAEIGQSLSWPINTVTPRVYELRSFGLVRDNGVRLCKVTGRSAHAWKVNV